MQQRHIRSSNVPSRAARWLVPVAGLLLVATGCQHASTGMKPVAFAPPVVDPSPHALQPGDWIVVRHRTYSPPEVISREEYIELRREGVHLHTPNSLERKPPNLLDTHGTVRVKVGQVEAFVLEDAPVKRLILSGGTVEAYWSKPYTIHRQEPNGSISLHQGSDIYFRGYAPGPSRLKIEFTNGAPPRYVDISGAPSRANVRVSER